MRLAKYTKQEAERKRHVLDYSDWLDSGETLTQMAFSVSPTTASPLVVDASSISTDNRSAIYFVSGGLNATTYTITVTATTTVGQVKEDEVVYAVRNT